MEQQTLFIILGAVLGTFVLLLILTMVLFCWRRSKRRMVRGFSLRAVTPLDDAEFESWRRPSQYTRRPEKYGIKPTQPAIVRTTKTPILFEKEMNFYVPPRTPSPEDIKSPLSPSSSIQKPERARRKSSVASYSSLADRPPTPYSPASVTGEFPRRGSHASRKSGSAHVHYPSMSEASAFDFEFDSEFGSPPKDPSRPSHQSDRPLYYSYSRHDGDV